MPVRLLTRFVLSGLILFFLVFAMWPTIYEWNSRDRIKPTRYFELVHNFPTDYQLYLSKIRQGKEGAWLAKEKYTTEPHGGSLSQILYIWIGRISDWVHIQTPYVWVSYHAMRVFFAVVLMITIWHLTGSVFTHVGWRLLAFVLIITASTWPKFETVNGWPRFGGYMPWYTMVDSLQRTVFMPHVLFGQSMLAFVMWVFSGGFITKKSSGNAIFLGIVGIVLGIIFPPALVFLYGVLFFWSIWDFLLYSKANISKVRQIRSVSQLLHVYLPFLLNTMLMRIVFIVMTAPTILYYSLLLSQYPWKRLVEFDILHPTKFSYMEYFLAMGATLPFGLIGIGIALLQRNSVHTAKLRGYIVWVLAWLFFVFVFNFIPQQSPTRFSQMVPHVPLGLFTAYGVYVVSNAFSKRRRGTTGFGISDVVLFIPIVIIALGLGTMFSSWLWQKDFVDHKLRADIPLVPRGAEVMYPLYDLVDAMVWLQVHTPRDVAVLTGPASGNLVPVYAGNYTYVGHANTVESEKKQIVVANFYAAKRPAQEFIDLFRANNIGYVVFGPEEKEISGGKQTLLDIYPFLREVYANKLVTVYQVQM